MNTNTFPRAVFGSRLVAHVLNVGCGRSGLRSKGVFSDTVMSKLSKQSERHRLTTTTIPFFNGVVKSLSYQRELFDEQSRNHREHDLPSAGRRNTNA